MANKVITASKKSDMSASQKRESVIEVTEPPKIPTLTLNFKRPSMFGGNKVFGPKGAQKGKFNNATFHTQHKGGPSGGK